MGVSYRRVVAPRRSSIAMRSVLRGFQLGVLLLISAPVAFAQTGPQAASEPPPATPSPATPAAGDAATTPPPAARDPKGLEEARRLFWEAHSHFEKGQYAEALLLFERTYALRPEPEVLFNLALTHQRLGDCEQARALYQEYQARVHADVTKQLGELDAQCSVASEPDNNESAKLIPAPFSITVVQPPEPQAERQPLPTAPVAADAAGDEPFPFRTVGWVAVGAAAVALGATVYFAVDAGQHRSDYEEKYAQRDDPDPPDNYNDQLAGLEDDMDRAQKFALVTGIVSGALAVGGVTLLVVAPSSSATTESDPARQLGLGLRWAGSF